MVATYIKKIMHKIIFVILCVFKGDNQHAFGWSNIGFVKNSNIWILSDTINVLNVLLTELYLFIPLSVTLTIFQRYSNVEQFN